MPGSVKYRDNSYRRMRDKTKHSQILTLFGIIRLIRATYRRGSAGKVIAPLEKSLGIECGASPAALELIDKQMAIAGASQQRAKEAIEARSGAKIGHAKIRNIVKFAHRNSICQRSLMIYNRTERIQRIAPVDSITFGLPATVANNLPKSLVSSHQTSASIPSRSKIGAALAGVVPRLSSRNCRAVWSKLIYKVHQNPFPSQA